MSLPTLYKRTSTGAIQTWRIWVEDDTILTEYGQLNGKMQQSTDQIKVGKNVGRSNETTPQQQAQLEAISQWEKKSKKGYVENVDDADAGAVNEDFITGGINPMLAQSYSKHAAKIVWPAYHQPKLDGHRCVAMRQDGVWTLWSRTRKPILGLPHIIAALDLAFDGESGANHILDGELYNHEYRDKFEELTSFIKRPDPKPGHEIVQYHIYDLPGTELTFDERRRALSGLELLVDDPLVIVPTGKAANFEEAQEAFAEYLDAGYEGLMLRNADSLYVEKRSYDLQKVKEFDDAEFKIVGVEEGRGRLAGKGVFVCQAVNGETFSVKLKGSLDNLELDKLRQDVGSLLTVQYQGLTAYGVPRFPVGLRIRQDV